MAYPGSPATDNQNKVTAGEFVGRDLKFLKIESTGIDTNYTYTNSNFANITRVVQKFGTTTIVGTPASGVAIYVVEGLPTGSVKDINGSSVDIAQAIGTDANAAVGSGTIIATVYNGLSGTSFA